MSLYRCVTVYLWLQSHKFCAFILLICSPGIHKKFKSKLIWARVNIIYTFTRAQCASIWFNSDRKIIQASIGVHWLICLLQTRKTSGKGILKKKLPTWKTYFRCIQQKYHIMTAHFCCWKKILIERVAVVVFIYLRYHWVITWL